MKNTAKNIKEYQDMVQFNFENPIGTAVIVTEDDGSKTNSVTTSLAWMVGQDGEYLGHTAVIGLEGKRGGFMLSRVKRSK